MLTIKKVVSIDLFENIIALLVNNINLVAWAIACLLYNPGITVIGNAMFMKKKNPNLYKTKLGSSTGEGKRITKIRTNYREWFHQY